MQVRRYAVYYLPPPGEDWARLGRDWLGWDIETGRPAGPLALPGPAGAITETPRRYGLHATLKPPFRLADGTEPAGLEAALAGLAARLAPAMLEGLALTRLGRFLALCPTGPTTALDRLAAACVADLDAFRAPPSPAELARRRAAGLSPAQEARLRRWGYPHVMEGFRFHITLTGRLPSPDLDAVESALSARFASALPRPLPIDQIALVGEREDGFFQLLRRFPLGGKATR